MSVDRSHGALVLTARGELDMASVALLEEELRRAESADVKQVVLDLAEVEFMDSSGLHALLRARERIEQHGSGFSVSRVSPQIRRLLELTATLEEFAVDGMEQAVPARVGRGAHA